MKARDCIVAAGVLTVVSGWLAAAPASAVGAAPPVALDRFPVARDGGAVPRSADTTPGAAAEDSAARARKLRVLALEMPWWSVDGGGGTSSGGQLTLTGTIGQPESGMATAGTEIFDGGLWSTSIDLGLIFADGFETGDVSAWDASVGGPLDATLSKTGGK